MRIPSLRASFRLTPTARKVLLVLVAIEVVMVVVHIITRQPQVPRFSWRLFDLAEEQALGALFSSWQMVAVGVLAIVNGLYAARDSRWGRVYWWLLAAVFIFLGADEYFTLHENLAQEIGNEGQLLVYGAGGALLAGIVLAAYWFGLRSESGPVAVLVVGLGIIAIGGLLIDYIQCRRWLAHTFNFLNARIGNMIPGQLDSCVGTYPYEEFFEMAGVTVVLAGFVTYAQERLNREVLRRATIAVGAVTVLAVIFFVGSIWVFPSIEARVLAEPLEVTYLDGSLSLTGYRVRPSVAGPGDRVTIDLYWRANERIPTYYYQSTHLVTHPEVLSVTQQDVRIGGWLGWRTDTWFPGLVMRDRVRLRLPDDAPTSQSYWMTLNVFEWDGHEYRIDFSRTEDVLPSETALQMLGDDTVVVFSLPVLSGDAPQPPPEIVDFRFADGFRLSGQDLPERATAGETVSLGFWWEADVDVEPDLTQFIHLSHTGSDAFFAFDQPPFGGRFPTSDWPDGMAVVDEVDIALQADMPAGQYRVQTGMYVLETGERRVVSDGAGQPVTDFSIVLGTIDIEP